MNYSEEKPSKRLDKMQANAENKATRKLIARSQRRNSMWFGLGMFGLVGWSVTVPTVIGIGLGLWLDHTWPSRVSWTITLLFVGVVLGCMQAWHWIKRESGHD